MKMPYKRYKKKTYRKKRYKKKASMYTIAKRVIAQSQETKRFLPMVTGPTDVTDGWIPSTDSRFDQRTLDWNLDSLSGDTIGYIKPFVLAPEAAGNDTLNQDGDHIIEGKSINPTYISVKCHLKNVTADNADAYGPVRIVALRLRDNNTILPDANTSPTETGKGGLFNRIDTDKYWVLKDTTYNLVPTASNVPREMNYSFFRKLRGKFTYNIPASGQIVEDTYPSNGVFLWFFFNRPFTDGTNAPIVNGTYSVGFKDS